VNVGTITASTHSGTHADAPFHFRDDGDSVEHLDLATYVGPARLIEVQGSREVTQEQLAPWLAGCPPRLLIRTGAWPDPGVFPTHIPVFAAEVPALLAARGIKLVGIDLPSVDQIDSSDLPLHHSLDRHGIRILESLALRGVPTGDYDLIALPLPIAGADGSPVRAILRPLAAHGRERARH
jgi:arylformamidase